MLSAILLPWMAVGFLASGHVGRRISPQGIRRILLTLCAASALGILVKVAYFS